MLPGARNKRLVAWIACAAMIAGMLLPALAGAANGVRALPAVVAELCSASGGGPMVIRAAFAPADEPAQHGATSRAAHCPGCLSSHDPAALPSTRTIAHATAASQARTLQPPAHEPALRAPWSPANPRAPPLAG